MAKEDKPLEYQRRLRDTKGVAQRLDLDYLKRPALLGLLRKRLTWALVAAAAAGMRAAGDGRRRKPRSGSQPDRSLRRMRCLKSAAKSATRSAFGGVPDQACRAVPRWRRASGQAHRYGACRRPRPLRGVPHGASRQACGFRPSPMSIALPAMRKSPLTPPAPRSANVTAFAPEPPSRVRSARRKAICARCV